MCLSSIITPLAPGPACIVLAGSLEHVTLSLASGQWHRPISVKHQPDMTICTTHKANDPLVLPPPSLYDRVVSCIRFLLHSMFCLRIKEHAQLPYSELRGWLERFGMFLLTMKRFYPTKETPIIVELTSLNYEGGLSTLMIRRLTLTNHQLSTLLTSIA